MLTTARAGSGKTYLRCARFLVDEFLPDSKGEHWSNFPVYPERVGEAVALRKKEGKENGPFYARRIKLIPAEVLHQWQLGKSGPWDFFQDIDVQNAHIAIDEIHKYCGRNASKDLKKKWQIWCGEIRHRGATVEFISQHYRKIAQEVIDESGIRLQLVNSEDRRDWFFRILMGDWYEVKAALLTGEYETRVWVYEKREVDGKWTNEDKRTFVLDPYYFGFYDSYSAPDKGGLKGTAKEQVFEKRGKLGTVKWFLRRNWWRFIRGGVILAIVIYFLTGGGGRLMHWFLNSFTGQFISAASPASLGMGKSGRSLGNTVPPAPGPGATSAGATALPSTQPNFVAIADYKKQQERADEAERKLKSLSGVFDKMGEVVLLSPNAVTLRSGLTYRVGDKVEWGPFAGKTVKSVDIAKAVVRFDDGTLAGLGSRELRTGVTDALK
ncbi:MAG TPA: hypothetical protein VHQ47_06005 [Phycisphaerae bacterium]|jgi:hypothetical protein|nr:hypothetical protein [Phycisphaerae bacterium]